MCVRGCETPQARWAGSPTRRSSSFSQVLIHLHFRTIAYVSDLCLAIVRQECRTSYKFLLNAQIHAARSIKGAGLPNPPSLHTFQHRTVVRVRPDGRQGQASGRQLAARNLRRSLLHPAAMQRPQSTFRRTIVNAETGFHARRKEPRKVCSHAAHRAAQIDFHAGVHTQVPASFHAAQHHVHPERAAIATPQPTGQILRQVVAQRLPQGAGHKRRKPAQVGFLRGHTVADVSSPGRGGETRKPLIDNRAAPVGFKFHGKVVHLIIYRQ